MTYKFVCPNNEKMQKTTVHVPGYAWDTVFNKTVYILAVDDE